MAAVAGGCLLPFFHGVNICIRNLGQEMHERLDYVDSGVLVRFIA